MIIPWAPTFAGMPVLALEDGIQSERYKLLQTENI